MCRVAVILAALLPAAMTGCRSVPSGLVTDTRANERREARYESTTPTSEVRRVAFDEQEYDADQAKPRPTSPATIPATRPVATLSLPDIEQFAFQHNPTLSVAAARVHAARGKQVQAGLYPNPVIGYHATEIGNRGTAGQQGGFISQRFITAGKLDLDQAIAGKEIDEAHFRLHAQEQRVLSDVRVRFYDALVAQRRVELTQELSRIGEDLVTATETLLEGRQGTDNDLLQAQIKADEAHILLDNATNEQLEAWQRLAAIVGTPMMQMAPLLGELHNDEVSLDRDSCYAMVLGNHPELNAAKKRVERARIVIERAKREPIPNVDLLVSVRHHNVTHSDVANVQLGIPIPILNRNQGNISATEAEWVAACNDVRRIELKLQDKMAVVWRKYTNARQQVDRYRDRMVPRAKESLDLVTGGYEKGQVEYLTLLTTQQTYVQVNLSYLDSMRELRAASSILNGQLLTDSLGISN